MKTKHLLRFLNRIAQYDADLEMIDVISIAVRSGVLSGNSSGLIFDCVKPYKHRLLKKRTVSPHNRKLLVTHLKQSMYSSYLKDIYEDVLEYFNNIVSGVARKGLNPDRLIGEHKIHIDANTLIKCRTYDKVIELVSAELIRCLENKRSTVKLIETLCGKLAITIDNETIDNVLPYLEVRHLLVHRDGVADDIFISKFPGIVLTDENEVRLDFDFIKKARSAIVSMVKEFDRQVIVNDLININEMQI